MIIRPLLRSHTWESHLNGTKKQLRDAMPEGTLIMPFSSDSEALEILKENFIIYRNGMIGRKDPGYVPTEKEKDAIDYLVLEWDYGYFYD